MVFGLLGVARISWSFEGAHISWSFEEARIWLFEEARIWLFEEARMVLSLLEGMRHLVSGSCNQVVSALAG